MQPTISAIVPLYNKENRVANCLLSIINQSIPPDEIIVVDDGSTDSSVRIADVILSTCLIPNKIIRQDNSGVSSARNVGVNFSTSEFIAFLDADDEWLPNFIEKSRALISDFPDGDLYCFSHIVRDSSNGEFIPTHGLPIDYRGHVKNYYQAAARGSVVNSSKVVLRKTTFLNIGGFVEDVKAGEDLFLWMNVAQSGRIVFDGTICTIVNQEHDNSRGARMGEVPYPLLYYSKNKGLLRNVTGIKRYLWKVSFLHIMGSLAAGRRKEAFSRLNYSFKLFPIRSLALFLIFLLPTTFFQLLRVLRRRT